MNVENRKLFTNRDARAKLATMGGIMASSPELLGTVQKFQEGGDVQQSMSDMFTPVQLGESVFYVDMQSGTVLDSQGSVVTDANIIEAASIQAVERAQASNTQAPEQIRTLGDIVAENPRTPERDTMFNNIKQQFSNLSPFSSSQATSDSGIMAKALEEIAARDPEAMARIKAGTSISSRVKDIVEPVAEQASLMNVAADSGPESGMFYDDVKAGFNILPPAPYLSEAEQLLQQETGPVISGPFANVPRNYGTGIEAAQLNATEAGYVPSPVTSGEELLAVTNTLPENPRFKNVLTDDLLSLVNEGDAAATTEMQRRMNQINEADVTDPDKNDPRRFGGVDPSFQDGSKYTPKKQSKTSSASPIASSIAESELVADLKDVFVGGDQIVITPNVLTKYNLTEEDISLDTLVTKRELENLSETVNKEEVLEKAVSATAEQPVQEFRDQEAALVESQGGLNSMRLEDTKDIRAQRAAKFADEEVNRQGPNIVFDPEKIQKEIDEGGSGSNSIIGDATGTNQNLSPKDSVKAYQAMYKEMLGMDDEDEEKEKWHQMAMIGFAIAAGQDPNALSNIAGGLLEGTKMARKDRMRKKDREDKFTMMAIQSADEDRRSLRDAGVRADERTQAQLNQIDLLELRGTLSAEAAEVARKAAFEDSLVTARNLAESNIGRDAARYGNVSERDKYLASESGKAAMATFNTVYQDASVSEKDKLSTIARRLQPAAAAEFQSKTGISLTGGGAGSVVTDGTPSKLVFTKDP